MPLCSLVLADRCSSPGSVNSCIDMCDAGLAKVYACVDICDASLARVYACKSILELQVCELPSISLVTAVHQ